MRNVKTLEDLLCNFKNINLNEKLSITKIEKTECFLANLFYENTNVKTSEDILKLILSLNKYNDLDPNKFLNGISKHIKNPLSPLYEHAIILCASLFKDSSFNFETFKCLDKFKDLMPTECFYIPKNDKLKTKFDDKIKVEIDKSLFSYRKPIKYLQEGIQIIKDETKNRLQEVYNILPFLIENASDRVIKAKSKEYFTVILNYDGFDLQKSEVLYSLTNRAYDILHKEILESLFGDKICLRFKVCLLDVLIKIIEREIYDINKIRNLLFLLVDKINKNEGRLNEFVLYNLKYILEICNNKLK